MGRLLWGLPPLGCVQRAPGAPERPRGAGRGGSWEPAAGGRPGCRGCRAAVRQGDAWAAALQASREQALPQGRLVPPRRPATPVRKHAAVASRQQGQAAQARWRHHRCAPPTAPARPCSSRQDAGLRRHLQQGRRPAVGHVVHSAQGRPRQHAHPLVPAGGAHRRRLLRLHLPLGRRLHPQVDAEQRACAPAGASKGQGELRREGGRRRQHRW